MIIAATGAPSGLNVNRRQKIIRRLILVAALMFAVVIGYSTRVVSDFMRPYDYRSWNHENSVVTTFASPNGRFDAVVFCQCDTPAMVSPFYFVHIFPRNESHRESSNAALAVSRRPFAVRWIDNAHLKVVPYPGQIDYFTNLWVSGDDTLPFVELVLSQDPQTPLVTPDGHFVQ